MRHLIAHPYAEESVANGPAQSDAQLMLRGDNRQALDIELGRCTHACVVEGNELSTINATSPKPRLGAH